MVFVTNELMDIFFFLNAIHRRLRVCVAWVEPIASFVVELKALVLSL